jgi:ABC-type bacteriocin/lantibiotic exporter with double-glycine peptidase domain
MSVELLKMDEATSALDAMTKREMIDTLLALRTERTVMMIVHWASTVQSADHVVVPDCGQLMGAGSYQDKLRCVCDSQRLMTSSPSDTDTQGGHAGQDAMVAGQSR